jgi:hypothetical protein
MPSFVLFVALCHKTGCRTTGGEVRGRAVSAASRGIPAVPKTGKKERKIMYEIKIISDATVEGPDLAELDVNLLERGLRQDMINRLEEVGLIIEGLEVKVRFLP